MRASLGISLFALGTRSAGQQQGRRDCRRPRDPGHDRRQLARTRCGHRQGAVVAQDHGRDERRVRRRRPVDTQRHRLHRQGGRRLGHPRRDDGVQGGRRHESVGNATAASKRRSCLCDVEESCEHRDRRRQHVELVQPRYGSEAAARSRGQCGAGLQRRPAPRRKPLHELTRCARQRNRRHQVVASAARRQRQGPRHHRCGRIRHARWIAPRGGSRQGRRAARRRPHERRAALQVPVTNQKNLDEPLTAAGVRTAPAVRFSTTARPTVPQPTWSTSTRRTGATSASSAQRSTSPASSTTGERVVAIRSTNRSAGPPP